MHPKSLIAARRVGLSALCTLIAIESLHAVADAQWLPDRSYTEGPGIRVGDLELHPGVAVRGGYDTNTFRSEQGREVGGALLAVTPHLNISTLSRQRMTQGEEAAGSSAPWSRPLAFNLGFSTTFFHMFVDRAPTNVEFDTEAMLLIKPDAPVGLDIGGAYQRNIRPFTEYTGSRANNEFARNRIAPDVRLRAQSRGGVLKAHVTYTPDMILYESNTFDYLNSISHNIRAGSSWRFLPYTALISDATVGFADYMGPSSPAAQVLVSDSTRFQARLGISGNITQRLSLRVLAGYAYENFDDSALDDYENVIGEAILGLGFGPHRLETGYQRAVAPSNIGGWLLMDRGMARASFLLGRVIALTFEAGAGKAHYGRILGPRTAPSEPPPPLGVDRITGVPTSDREDVRVDAAAHAEYRATNWLAFMVDFSAMAALTDFQYGRGVNIPPDPAEFVTYQVFGGVRLHY